MSTAPIHQAYRQALVQEPVVNSVGDKRRLDRQDALLELELKERNMSVIGSFCGLMSSLHWTTRRQMPTASTNAHRRAGDSCMAGTLVFRGRLLEFLAIGIARVRSWREGGSAR